MTTSAGKHHTIEIFSVNCTMRTRLVKKVPVFSWLPAYDLGPSHSVTYLNEWSQRKLPAKIKDYINSNLLVDIEISLELDHYTNDYLILLPLSDYAKRLLF